jgi:hypothetical protein
MSSPAKVSQQGQGLPRLPDKIRGKTFRWTWTGGPTKGSTHEHVFNEDGSVIWSCIAGAGKGHSAHEKTYAAEAITADVHVVSYLSSAGYTLTTVLNFADHSLVAFASGGKNGKDWHPCKGTFELVR